MADVAISGLTALGAAPATNDLLVLVDVSDTSQAPTGTTKSMTTANLFTSPTITGVTITTALKIGIGTTTQAAAPGQINFNTVDGIQFTGRTGSSYDLALVSVAGGYILRTPTGTTNIEIPSGTFTVTTGASSLKALTATTGVFSSTLGVTGDFAINTNKFTVAASTGNTVVAGTLGVTGAVTASGGLTVSGGTLVAAATAFSGDLAIATNKFTVAAASGNAVVAGTLGVTGVITATGGVVGAVTGNASTATALQNARTIGGVSFDGSGNITVTTATGGFTVSGGTLAAAATAFSGDMAIATNKFTVAAASGNTAIAGTLIVTGAIQSVSGSLNIATTADIGGNVTTSGVYKVASNQVVGARSTGWTTQTATGAKTDLGASPTNAALASWASAIQAALTTHGLIGT